MLRTVLRICRLAPLCACMRGRAHDCSQISAALKSCCPTLNTPRDIMSELFLASYLLSHWNILFNFSFILIGLISLNMMETSKVKMEAAGSSVMFLTEKS